MNRRTFLASASAFALSAPFCGCASLKTPKKTKLLFGVCRGPEHVPLLKSVGYDFFEWGVGSALSPDKDNEWWNRQKDMILSLPLPLIATNGFIPGHFRLTGPNANHDPALDYAERAMRRADEIGIKAIVFGSGGARNVPGDFCGSDRSKRPDIEKATDQFADFCRKLAERVSDLKTTTVVIEPLRPYESNIINYVRIATQIAREINSPRIKVLADIFHMMMGKDDPEAIVYANKDLLHCHIASYATRSFPDSDKNDAERFKPFFEALRTIGYDKAISCECGWGEKEDFAKNLETALELMHSLA